jgi:hypothetical protein
MSWKVVSARLEWPVGTVLSEGQLAGCNIAALVAGNHLSPVKATTKNNPAVAPEPNPKTGQED